ncbi:hypothetical protein [Streptomyces phaeochromogenes]
MIRIPDAVASLDTHRLVVAVPNDGAAEMSCNLPRPAGLDNLLAADADQLPNEEQQAPADWVADVREALAFNEGAQHPAVITLRDILLDDAPRTPEQALAAALVILAAHTRELSALARSDADEYRNEHGVNRSTRGLLTGMDHTRKLLDRHAARLDEETGQ